MVATTPDLGSELDHLLDGLGGELSLVIDGVRSQPVTEDRTAG